VYRVTPASPAILQRSLDRARQATTTYGTLGATKRGESPAGFRSDFYEVELKSGPDTFERARRGLSCWQAHVGAGAVVYPSHPWSDGDTVLVLLALGPFQVVAPCRIIYVIDEADRFGLAYGTLPGHPESGEESFVVERLKDDRVVFRIAAFSRPAQVLTRLGAPLVRKLQVRTTRRYLEALARFVADVEGT
jgi:uncharacterized protein (UPF0548 family)